MWTTNNWTADATTHYYGSHCTVSLMDNHGTASVMDEAVVDIDNSAALQFPAAVLPVNRELVVKINLTLALELPVPLSPFYKLIASSGDDESDEVKIGYCKAIFEVARCKRKYGDTFIRSSDRDVQSLVSLAADEQASVALRIQVFQALFNLLGPTSVLLDEHVVRDLLAACL
eukprot:Sspe_Gene.1226::Locus_413_Transcript_1_1_Confidence_1.000_Length_520::g.1226::m.1226